MCGGGAILSWAMSGAASRLKRSTSLSPSRRAVTVAGAAQWNSSLEKSAAWATRTSSTGRAAVAGAAMPAGATTLAMQTAATPDLRLDFRLMRLLGRDGRRRLAGVPGGGRRGRLVVGFGGGLVGRLVGLRARRG